MTAPRWFWWTTALCFFAMVAIAAQAVRAARWEPVPESFRAFNGYERDRWTGRICKLREYCGRSWWEAQTLAGYDSVLNWDKGFGR